MRFLFTAALLGMIIPVLANAAAQDPSNEEQLIIYLLNRGRSNPVLFQQENSEFVTDDLSGVTPRPPLAVNRSLVGSASFHAEEFITGNYFAHQSAVTGDWPNKMAVDNGYVLPSFYPLDANFIESIAFRTQSNMSVRLLAELIQDDGIAGKGHRVHLFALTGGGFETHREIGVGIAGATYMAIHTAVSGDTDLFLTGVVYNDANSNGRYDLGEGLGGVNVSAGNANTTTLSAGGWSLPITNGDYTVTVSGGAFSGTATRTVTVNNANAEIDFISGNPNGELNFENQSSNPGPGPGGGGDTGSTLVDTDGDGFYDSTEVAAGFSANDITSTPFGGQAAGTAQTLPAAKLAIALNFAKPLLDSVKLTGTLPVPDGFVYAGKQVVVDVGGTAKSFTLDEKGGAKPDKNNSIKLGKPKLGVAKYSVKISKGSFAANFTDESLTSTDAKAVSRHVTVVILFNSTVFQANQAQLYTAKTGKTGKTKQPKL